MKNNNKDYEITTLFLDKQADSYIKYKVDKVTTNAS